MEFLVCLLVLLSVSVYAQEDKWRGICSTEPKPCGGDVLCQEDAVDDSAQFAQDHCGDGKLIRADPSSEQCQRFVKVWRGQFGTTPDCEPDLSGSTDFNVFGFIQETDKRSWFDNSHILAFDDVRRQGRSFSNVETADCVSEARFGDALSNLVDLFAENNEVPQCPGVTYPAGVTTQEELFTYLRDKYYDELMADHDGSSVEPLVRKDIRTYTKAQVQNFVQAVKKVACTTFFDISGALHEAHSSQMHGGWGFFPSHAAFMRIYEIALHDLGGYDSDLGMPIAYWPIDFAVPDMRSRNSMIFDDDFFGSFAENNDGYGPFGQHLNAISGVDGEYVARAIRNSPERGGWISHQEQWDALSQESPLCFSLHADYRLHGSQHVNIGGYMGQIAIASFDPIFFGHHGWVDCMYREYQIQRETNYLTTQEWYENEIDSVYEAEGGWTAHRSTDIVDWLKWTSASGESREITNGQSNQYFKKGPGSYKCELPNLRPCTTDLDCGVPVNLARSEKNLYCSKSHFCAQYVKTGGQCRSASGDFLPCQKDTDRCQFDSALTGSHFNGRETASETNPAHWFCVADTGRICSKKASQSACEASAGDGCQWHAKDTSFNTCAFKTNKLGVVVNADAQVEPTGQYSFSFYGSEQTLTENHIFEDFSLGLHMDSYWEQGDEYGFAEAEIHQSEGGIGVTTISSLYDEYTPGRIGFGERLLINFDKPVRVTELGINMGGDDDSVVVAFYRRIEPEGDESSLVFAGQMVFGANQDIIMENPTVGAFLPGQEEFVGDIVLVTNGSPSGDGFKITYLLADPLDGELKKKRDTSDVASDVEGFCSGPPGGNDYEACASHPTCWATPKDNDGLANLVALPTGVCPPYNYKSLITLSEDGEAVYAQNCECDGASVVGPTEAAVDVDSSKYRELPNLRRSQDRKGGNQFSGARFDQLPAGGSGSLPNSASSLIAAFGVFAGIVAALF